MTVEMKSVRNRTIGPNTHKGSERMRVFGLRGSVLGCEKDHVEAVLCRTATSKNEQKQGCQAAADRWTNGEKSATHDPIWSWQATRGATHVLLSIAISAISHENVRVYPTQSQCKEFRRGGNDTFINLAECGN
jgi:hypothetical protein